VALKAFLAGKKKAVKAPAVLWKKAVKAPAFLRKMGRESACHLMMGISPLPISGRFGAA